MSLYNWPYANEIGIREDLTCDVLVLGGGLSGCFAAISAAQQGKSVILMEKGAAVRSGSAGTGFDHWESACTNPCSGVTPEEIAWAYVNEQDWYSNGIAHYIECREGYDRLLDVERFGGKVRDSEGEFAGAPFRDEKTGLMFAYDYKNKFTLRVWGSTFKPALVKEMKRLGVKVFDRTEATALLMAEDSEGRSRGAGAVGMNVHTGRLICVRSRATVLCMSRPARVWLFNADLPGLCEFRPFQSIGSGHAMGWRAGLEFTMMEKSVRAEFSAAGRSFPPYGAGNNHNTWYAATMVDARGVEIPYVDRDGKELETVLDRYMPAKGQKFFLKGGVIDDPKYEYRGPETLPFDELMRRGYRLPFYADLSRMPEYERRVIWGMMVGEEAKTKIPIYQNYTERGFDPEKHALQSYGTGWQSASFLDQERQFFGAPGGLMHDWNLMTNIDGIFCAGDTLYASDCAGFACATGHYAGRKAAQWTDGIQAGEKQTGEEQISGSQAGGLQTGGLPTGTWQAGAWQAGGRTTEGPQIEQQIELQIAKEAERLYAPLKADPETGISWRELNSAISKAMQNYCGGVKCDELLEEGLDLLKSFEVEQVPLLYASNPHDLMRIHEVLDILEVAKLVLHASLARKHSSKPLCFNRSDSELMDPSEEHHHIVIRQQDGEVRTRMVPLDFFGDLRTEYEKRNADYMETAGNTSEAGGAADAASETDSLARIVELSELGSVQLSAETVPCSVRPLIYDQEKCIGCNSCASVCQCDVLIPSPEKGKHPVVMYPGECYYCGACVMACPRKGAVRLQHPLMNRAKFIPV